MGRVIGMLFEYREGRSSIGLRKELVVVVK